MKRCNKCGITKSESEFHIDKRYNKPRSICKKCKNSEPRSARWQAAHKQRLAAYLKTDKGKAALKRGREKAAITKQSILAAIKEQGCAVCGYSKCITSLQFHHVDPSLKDKEISRVRTLGKLRDELAKCVVLCANCHGELHAGMIDDPALMVVREQEQARDEPKQMQLPLHPPGGPVPLVGCH